MKDYTCIHCGGQISPYSLKCEYCGTQYKNENDQIIRIETFNNPVETFTAAELVPMEMIYKLGAEKAGEMAVRHISQKLAQCITPFMRIDTENDPYTDSQKIRGTIKVVRPVHIDGDI